MTSKYNYLKVFYFITLMVIFGCQDSITNNNNHILLKQHEVDSLNLLTIALRNNAPDSIILISNRTIKISKSIDYSAGEIQSEYNKAIGYFLLSNYENAEECCENVLNKLEIASGIDSSFYHKLKGSTYILNGILEQRKGNYTHAVTLQLKALIHLESIDDQENIGKAHINISENFRFIKNFEKALYYNEKAEKLFIKENNIDEIPIILLNRGNILFDKGEHQLSLEMFKVALDKATELNNNRVIVNAINNIGSCHEALGEVEKALNYYLKALQEYKVRNNHWGKANTMGNISQIYLQLKQYALAKQYANNALDISRTHDFLELEKYNTENLARIFEKQSNYKKSLELWKSAQKLQDSLYNREKFETVNRLEKQYNEEKSNRLIAQKDKDIIHSKLYSQRLTNILTIMGLFISIGLLGVWFLHRQSKLRKSRNRALLAKNTIIQNQKIDLESLVNAYESQREKYITLGNNKIELDKIIYIKYHDRVSTIYLKSQKIIEHRIQLSQLMSELNYKAHFLFSQINQNYIIHFKNVEVKFNKEEEDSFYFVDYLSQDIDEYRNEEVIKTRKRSGITKNFEREYQRYIKLREELNKEA